MLGRVAGRGLLARAGPGQGCVRVHAATTHLEHAAGLDTSQHEDTFLAVYRLDVTVRAKLVTWVGAGVKGFWGGPDPTVPRGALQRQINLLCKTSMITD